MAETEDHLMRSGWQKNATHKNMLKAIQKPEASNPGIFRDINWTILLETSENVHWK